MAMSVSCFWLFRQSVMANGTADVQSRSAPAAATAPATLMLFREFNHVVATDGQTCVLRLWTVMDAAGAAQNMVTFNHSTLHGNWLVAKNANGSIGRLWIMFDMQRNAVQPAWYSFTPIFGTNGFRSQFDYSGTTEVQSLHSIGSAAQPFALASGVADETQHIRHCGSFMHVAANWKDARSLSLWKVYANGQTRNLVSFENKSMHGSWGTSMKSDGSIALLNIKFHFDADEELAWWHFYVSIEGTDDFRSKFDAQRPKYSQTLYAVHAIMQDQ
jgi:hypothetical protein